MLIRHTDGISDVPLLLGVGVEQTNPGSPLPFLMFSTSAGVLIVIRLNPQINYTPPDVSFPISAGF